MNTLMKVHMVSLFVIVVIIFAVDDSRAQDSYLPGGADVKAEQKKEGSTDDVSRDPEDAETKAEKISKTISTMPERTGNIFLEGFNKVGNWLEEKSGNRFETKWNPQHSDDPSLSPEHYGFERDPAKGI